MSFSPFIKLTGSQPQYGRGTYGIEVEAEHYPPNEVMRMQEHERPEHPLLRALSPYWKATTDGSLRHNGVEFISVPLALPQATTATEMLYTAMAAGLFRPSVRAGIHVHVNMAPATSVEFVQALRAYILLEPLLFRYVGVEREQNIYCVPIYRAVNEQRLWQRVAKGMHEGIGTRNRHNQLYGAIRDCCKYSALNLNPFIRLGTFEFRHAPTFSTRQAAINWLRLVHEVSTFVVQGTATLASLEPAKAWASVLVPALDWDEYMREVQERGLLGLANSLEPFTYKAPEWGKPAGLAFDRIPARTPRQAAPARPRATPGIRLPEMTLDGLMAEMRVSARPVGRVRMEELLDEGTMHGRGGEPEPSPDDFPEMPDDYEPDVDEVHDNDEEVG